MRFWNAVAAGGMLAAVAWAGAVAQEAAEGGAGAVVEDFVAPTVVLMELYTSQGCYSCPPADDLMRTEYAPRADVLPLEFHVDYWDDLVYGAAGVWKDPFSSARYTARQQAYNVRIRGTHGVYTPQLIVQGRFEAVGSRRARVEAALADARAGAAEEAAGWGWGWFGEEDGEGGGEAEAAVEAEGVRFYFSGGAAAGWRVRVVGRLQGNEDLFYARFLRRRVTQVRAGENKGKAMTNTNVVRELKRGRGREVTIPSYEAADEGCAVWVQKPQTGAVVAAAACPDSVGGARV